MGGAVRLDGKGVVNYGKEFGFYIEGYRRFRSVLDCGVILFEFVFYKDVFGGCLKIVLEENRIEVRFK